MDAPPSDFRLQRFWSDDFPVHQRVAAWRAVLARKLLEVEIEPLSTLPFPVDASLRALADFRFGVGLFGPSINRRTREIVRSDNDDVFLLINLEGPLVVGHGGAETELGEGDAWFMSCAQEGRFTRRVMGRLICARFRRAGLAALVQGLEECEGRVIRRDSEALRLLASYLRGLDDNQALATEELRKLATAQVYDLLALVLNAALGPAQGSHARGQGAARLRAIKAYVVDHLDLSGLSIGDAAAAHRLSPRHVQRFFEAEGTTFSEFVLAKRLQRVHATLSDSRQSHRSISDIALSAGFGDVSHFNRAFRRHYGASPTQVRSRGPSPPQPADS